jgi:CubicO group peptidase (beta-lactamase class C family)
MARADIGFPPDFVAASLPERPTRCKAAQEHDMQGFPLSPVTLAEAGLRGAQINRLETMIEAHIAQGRYPGCQIAIARHGKLALERSFGFARMGARGVAHAETLWPLFSNTKVIVAIVLWILAERGALRFTDRVSDHVPDFARHGKQHITVLQVVTHQGGFPAAKVPEAAWRDRALLRQVVCDFVPEWPAGSRVSYHPASAHWVLAVLIEALTGQDVRDVIRECICEPLGLSNELFVGLPAVEHDRAADMHEAGSEGFTPVADRNSADWREAGVPGGGGYASARAMAALYQMMLRDGALGVARVVGPRVLRYAIRNWTADRVDDYMGMPMHRGLGPHLRGTTSTIRGLGALASPGTFGHGGVGSSYCWGDPESGVSFAYLTNCRIPDPWHSLRMDAISNIVHAAIT